jgi:hypothetical protein
MVATLTVNDSAAASSMQLTMRVKANIHSEMTKDLELITFIFIPGMAIIMPNLDLCLE